MLTDEQIDKAREVARKTYNYSRSQVRGQMLSPSDDPEWHLARAIESAATEPMLQRIAELARQLEEARKDAERYRWLRDIAGMGERDSVSVYCGNDFDGSIDAAMKGQQ